MARLATLLILAIAYVVLTPGQHLNSAFSTFLSSDPASVFGSSSSSGLEAGNGFRARASLALLVSGGVAVRSAVCAARTSSATAGVAAAGTRGTTGIHARLALMVIAAVEAVATVFFAREMLGWEAGAEEWGDVGMGMGMGMGMAAEAKVVAAGQRAIGVVGLAEMVGVVVMGWVG